MILELTIYSFCSLLEPEISHKLKRFRRQKPIANTHSLSLTITTPLSHTHSFGRSCAIGRTTTSHGRATKNSAIHTAFSRRTRDRKRPIYRRIFPAIGVVHAKLTTNPRNKITIAVVRNGGWIMRYSSTTKGLGSVIHLG